jgi:hypothetical protein
MHAIRKSTILVVMAACILAVACASVPPSAAPLELFVSYQSGGVWPTVVNARIHADGTLAFGDGRRQLRHRVSTTHAEFMGIMRALEETSFRDEFRAAAVPSAEWQSSGAWIRLQRGETVALIKPPVESEHIRDVLIRVNVLFGESFGRRYQPVELQ